MDPAEDNTSTAEVETLGWTKFDAEGSTCDVGREGLAILCPTDGWELEDAPAPRHTNNNNNKVVIKATRKENRFIY